MGKREYRDKRKRAFDNHQSGSEKALTWLNSLERQRTNRLGG
jgi:hypothetical protein